MSKSDRRRVAKEENFYAWCQVLAGAFGGDGICRLEQDMANLRRGGVMIVVLTTGLRRRKALTG